MATTIESRKRKTLEDSSEFERAKKKPRAVHIEDYEERSGSDTEEEIPLASDNVDNVVVTPYLPPEILFKIFDSNIFSFSDQRKASCVCKSWSVCLKKEAFIWSPIYHVEFSKPLPGMPK